VINAIKTWVDKYTEDDETDLLQVCSAVLNRVEWHTT
jgi:hypothetical protein